MSLFRYGRSLLERRPQQAQLSRSGQILADGARFLLGGYQVDPDTGDGRWQRRL